MNTEERFEMTENHKAEFLAPAFKSTYCQNCQEPKEEMAHFNYYTELLGMPIKIQTSVCLKCIPEVISYRWKMRNVAEMTKELVKAEGWRMYYEHADQLTPYRRVNHI